MSANKWRNRGQQSLVVRDRGREYNISSSLTPTPNTYSSSLTATGFTFLEILAVLVITGLGIAIAIPTYFDKVQSARETEAQMHIKAIMIFQQDYYIQHGNFATNVQTRYIASLETENYIYSTRRPEDGVENVLIKATPKNSDLRGFIGAIAVFNGVFKTVVCQVLNKGVDVDQVDINKEEHTTKCGLGTKPIN